MPSHTQDPALTALEHLARSLREIEQERDTALVALSLVSGALADAWDVPVGPAVEYGDRVRDVVRERDAARAEARALAEWLAMDPCGCCGKSLRGDGDDEECAPIHYLVRKYAKAVPRG